LPLMFETSSLKKRGREEILNFISDCTKNYYSLR
jgi:hypothetical protein